ncbi:uncharacterized protein [Salminus brasiliensis]|uniref:uncharacterized protein n=1 Tax=Salminus brasiliensis TaxID=930266 RepID=UPI003B82F9BD
MKTHLRIVLIYQVLMCVEVETNSGNVFVGTEGGSVEIHCRYPDSYIHTPKYFCRDPCGYLDVLIETQKGDEVVSKDRYSILNTVSARSISVTIRNVRLKDSGVYYCGVNKWGIDIIIKVQVSVRKVSASAQPSTAPLSTLQTTESENPTTTSVQTADYSGTSTTHEQTSSATQTLSSVHIELPVYGGALGLLLCCVLVALVVFYRRRSTTFSTSLKPPAPENQISDPPPEQEEVCHVYDEMLAVYSLAGPDAREETSETYSVIQHAPPAEDDSPYSLIAHH